MRRILSVLFTLLTLITCSQAAFAKGKCVKFVQVSDVHYFYGNDDVDSRMKELAKDINKIDGVDFVVFTGDNIDSPDVKALHGFLHYAGKIKAPKYFVIGNHDVSTNSKLDKAKYFDVIRSHNWFYPAWKPNYVFKKNGVVFVIVDGAKQVIPGPNGYYKKETLQWLDKVLAKNKKSPVIILQHFPLVEPRKSNSHKTYKADEYLALLDKYENIVAVVAGHYHSNGETMRNGVYHVASPAFAEEPHYYKVIEVVSTKNFLPMIFTQLREFDL